MSGRMLGGELQVIITGAEGCSARSMYLNHRMAQSHPAVVHHWLVYMLNYIDFPLLLFSRVIIPTLCLVLSKEQLG